MNWPDEVEVVKPGLDELLEDTCVTPHLAGYVIRNFIPAQEATRSAKARLRLARQRCVPGPLGRGEGRS